MTGGHRDVVAIGASAGGVEAMRALAGGLPPDYPGSVLMVLHVPRDGPTALPAIISRSGPLPAALAVDGEELRHGRIYIAPNDRHLLVVDGHLRLSRGPTENGHRPAVDPLFRSVARACTARAIGVVLSGARDDGAAGLAMIAAHGGTTVVQDPADALYPSMPRAAIEHVCPDHLVPAAKLGGLLGEITDRDLPGYPSPPPDPLLDAEVAIANLAPVTTDELAVAPAGYGCPSCGGSLFEIPGSPVPRYRCRVGHAWSPDSLLDEQAVALEGALWMALRALEDKAALSRRMAADRAGRRSSTGLRFHDIADEAQAAGATIRDLITRIGAGALVPERTRASDPDVR